MAVYLKDIAAYTGVSIKTVSNVVNGKYERVSPETCAVILEALEKFQYQPNIAARHLRNAQVGVIALTIPDLSNPYFSDIGNAITAAAARYGYTVLLDYTQGDREKELLVVKGLRPHLIDGVILDTVCLTVEDIQAAQIQERMVLLGERLFGAPCDHIVIDNEAAAYTATAHLLSIGRKRIAAIGDVEHGHNETPALRLQGFTRALREAGRTLDPALLAPGGLWHRADGAAAMRTLLSLPEPPDAVFCFNDLMALGALSVLHEAGLRIPQDVAIVGFDDIEDGRYATPSLTTIAPDKEELARLAVSLLVERIKKTRTQPPEAINVPFQLCVRHSTVV
ncbi:MAG TPA: LacI family DNA-binding transcriptional regulator [Ktedonobacteraceae bacterium]|nr:LacI family DNA-binding transcriptional regulator [Ktedonobacteraceae bacterium]